MPPCPTVLAHRETDPFARDIHLGDANLNDIARFHDFMRVFYEFVGQLADMDKSVLMNADIDEGAKGRDIGDGPLKAHSGFEVGDRIYIVGEARCFKLGSRIAAGFLEFRQNVPNGRAGQNCP